jgi:glycosyltransferase involved in cell wall biosynthesis
VPLHIGVNALYLIPGRVGGTEIYLRCLLSALAETDKRNHYFVYLNTEAAGEEFAAGSPNIHLVPCGIRAEFRPSRMIWEQTVFPWRLRRNRIDVLFNPGFTAPLLFAGPSVTVFHDLQHKRHPEFFRWFELPFWNLFLRIAAARSRCLIAVSDATAADLARFYPSAANKVVVVPHGVDLEFFRICERRRSRPGDTSKYLLTVSTLHPHKNLTRLLEAFRSFRKAHPEFQLVIAGLKGFAAQELESHRRTLGLEDSVTFTGWIPRTRLYELFEDADAYIAPSEFEGFGMPVLEALAAGLPTACSGIAPLKETTGDAATHFDPFSIDEMLGAMTMITTDSRFRRRAAVAGPEQARRYDWRNSAILTLHHIEKTVTRRASGNV